MTIILCIYVHICKNTCERLPNTRCFVFYSVFPFAISFANLSRCGVFSFAAIHVSEMHSRELSRKILKEFPVFPGKHILKHLFPACHVRVSRFYQSSMPPIASSSSSSSSSFTSSSSTPPSTASSRSQWALPGFNRERQISVGTAGPQLRPPDLSGYSQTPRAPDHSGHCHSLSNGEGPSQLVRAFAELSRSFRGFSGRIYRNVNNISVWIQIHLRTLSINIHLKLKTRILMDFEP